jgi:predicted  nucleic acid-binding Zn-ribbon protein
MPRKKTAKGPAKNKKATNNSFVGLKKMEKDFHDTPAQLSAQLNKEISVLKQKENKLKSALNKSKAQVAQAEKKIKAAAKNKSTSAGKKQWLAAKKNHSQLMKSHIDLNKQHQEIFKSIETATTSQSKYAALRKHLSQFEKDWAKQVKKLKLKAKAKAKVKKAKVRKVNAKPAAAMPIEDKSPQTDTFESILNDVSIDEAELTS